jgi:hypothetical protein
MFRSFHSAEVAPQRATRLTLTLEAASHVPGNTDQLLRAAFSEAARENATVAHQLQLVSTFFLRGAPLTWTSADVPALSAAAKKLWGDGPADKAAAAAIPNGAPLQALSVYMCNLGLLLAWKEMVQRGAGLAQAMAEHVQNRTEDTAMIVDAYKARAKEAGVSGNLFLVSRDHAIMAAGHRAVGASMSWPALMKHDTATFLCPPTSLVLLQNSVDDVRLSEMRRNFEMVTGPIADRVEEAMSAVTLYDSDQAQKLGFAPVLVAPGTTRPLKSVAELGVLMRSDPALLFTPMTTEAVAAASSVAAPSAAPAPAGPPGGATATATAWGAATATA